MAQQINEFEMNNSKYSTSLSFITLKNNFNNLLTKIEEYDTTEIQQSDSVEIIKNTVSSKIKILIDIVNLIKTITQNIKEFFKYKTIQEEAERDNLINSLKEIGKELDTIQTELRNEVDMKDISENYNIETLQNIEPRIKELDNNLTNIQPIQGGKSKRRSNKKR